MNRENLFISPIFHPKFIIYFQKHPGAPPPPPPLRGILMVTPLHLLTIRPPWCGEKHYTVDDLTLLNDLVLASNWRHSYYKWGGREISGGQPTTHPGLASCNLTHPPLHPSVINEAQGSGKRLCPPSVIQGL